MQISTSEGLGSGIIFDKSGNIVTNDHVVGTATAFTVTTSTGKRLKGSLVGRFTPDDLAVIKVNGTGLRPATFADSSRLQVGDIAMAIGNPLGLSSSVTEGIVSALNRQETESNGATLPNLIQTSAPINPGNSGGALVDIHGRVIGIPTLAAQGAQLGVAGIGFAIPSNVVTDIAGQIVKNGHVVNSHRAYLAITVGETGGNGVYVGSVTPGGPAAKAGIVEGDVIVSVNAKATRDAGRSFRSSRPPQAGPVRHDQARSPVRRDRHGDGNSRRVPGQLNRGFERRVGGWPSRKMVGATYFAASAQLTAFLGDEDGVPRRRRRR